jgi:hypothetical protein
MSVDLRNFNGSNRHGNDLRRGQCRQRGERCRTCTLCIRASRIGKGVMVSRMLMATVMMDSAGGVRIT